MSEKTIPISHITDFDKQCLLAGSINRSVREPNFNETLRKRHLLGVIGRHTGKLTKSELSVFEAYKAHNSGIIGVFTLESAGVFVGMATVDPKPTLRKQRFNLPPKFAYGPLSSEVPFNGPEITAWIDPSKYLLAEGHLSRVYAQLKDPNGLAERQFDIFNVLHPELTGPVQAWTIEPLDAPSWIHRAIKRAGFNHSPTNTGIYDDGESRRHSPPPSRLYIAAPPLS